MDTSIFLDGALWLGAGYVFLLRLTDMSLDTLRVLFVLRGRKGLAWVLGFFQSLVFVIAITSVLSNLDNILMMLGYAAGFATGNVLGMTLEEKLAVGHTHLQLVSPRRGAAVAARLRTAGYALTELMGTGKDGTVTVISCTILRRQVASVIQLAQEADPEVFVTAEEVRPLRRGYWRS